jgi:endonuclease/exonuclease/phosphatase family metal-dependent hydrolase
MRILSCNIRYFGAPDGADRWEHRKECCINTIRSCDPDLIGCQEVWAEQVVDMQEAFPKYAWYGIVDEVDGKNPVDAIFYRRDKYDLISSGGYWLSETPHITGSSSWDSTCIRLANWVRLRDRLTGKTFRCINTHLDHISQPARENQARLILEDAAAYAVDFPQILTGDMNSDGKNKAMQSIIAADWVDTYAAVHGAEAPAPTFHGFQGPAYQGELGRIDWIFVRGGCAVTTAAVIEDHCDGRYPSDHHFVMADIDLT